MATYQEQMEQFFKEHGPLEIPSGKELIKQAIEVRIRAYGEQEKFNFSNPRFEVQVVPDDTYGYKYEVSGSLSTFLYCLNLKTDSGRLLTNLVRFSLAAYPHCCGMKQLNGFHCDHRLTGPDIDVFTKLCFKAYKEVFESRVNRVMINLVEIGRHESYRPSRDETKEYEEVPDAQMNYPAWVEWAKSQRKYRSTLMMNANSGNIIHHAEVVL